MTSRHLAIVIGLDLAKDSFRKIHLFDSESGCMTVLKRSSSKKSQTTAIDLFQNVEIIIDRKTEGQMGFVKEHSVLKTRDSIAKNYRSFEFASLFCRTVFVNAQHMPHPETVFDLVDSSLDAWASKPNPEATFLKALYRLASDDGFPVKQSWYQKLSPEDQEHAHDVLTQPLETQTTPPAIAKRIAEDLKDWLATHYEFRF